MSMEMPDETDFAKYKRQWNARAVKEREDNDKRRLTAYNEALKLSEILAREFGVQKVILFGSVLGEKDFFEDSDIDMAVEGLPSRLYFKAVGRLMMESSFPVDLKPVEDLSGSIREKVLKGKILYEKGKNS